MKTMDKGNITNLKKIDHINHTNLDNNSKVKWQDWRTSTFGYTVDSVENLDMLEVFEYINKIKNNIKNQTSPYSEEYLKECLMYIEAIINGSYEYIDLLENIGAYYPDREKFIECLKRVSQTLD